MWHKYIVCMTLENWPDFLNIKQIKNGFKNNGKAPISQLTDFYQQQEYCRRKDKGV